MSVADFVANEISQRLKFTPTTCQANLFSELGGFLMAPADESWLFLISFAMPCGIPRSSQTW